MSDSLGKDDNDGGEHTRVRWLITVGRYAVAALVTAVTVAVIVRAAAVSARSEKLSINVVNGTVTASVTPTQVKLSVGLSSKNPSGRVGIKYQGVNVTLLYPNGTLIAWIGIEDGPVYGIEVGPELVRDSFVTTILDVPADVSREFAGMMMARNGPRRVENATVHLNGTLQTQISGLNYTHGGHATEYSCYPVTIGVLSGLNYTHGGDVSCVPSASNGNM
ncbi:uncharacterized protein LOC119334282 [Triticum dicoccoides]|uniref:uncharacterized protein LOC119334282 n=1 Tax=Triticum dicoccoides TaxID=85692 RepID=UPI0018913CD2|nr:uncharacterized protein LOC119334282 [Triticum dicoccoides]